MNFIRGEKTMESYQQTLLFNQGYYKSETKRELIRMLTDLERDEGEYLDQLDNLSDTVKKQEGIIEYLQGLLNDLQKEGIKNENS
jgi:hypothetical protein